MIRIITVASLVLILSFHVKPQSHFQIKAGANFPVGEFFNQNRNISVGTAFNARYYYTLKNNGLSFYFEAGFFFNKFIKEYKDSIEVRQRYFVGGTGYTMLNLSEYYNIPMLIGMNYTLKISKSVGLIADCGAGINILKLTKYESIMHELYERSTFSPSLSFAYKGGIGLIIKDHIIVAFDYYGLGNHDLDQKLLFFGDIYDRNLEDLKCSLLSFTAGYSF